MSGNDKKKLGAFKIIAIVVAVLIIGLIVLPFFIDVNQFRPELESKLTAALGREVKTGNLSLSLFSGGVGVGDIVISDDPKFSSSPFLKAESLKVGVELVPLIFSKEIRITEITLKSPAINLIRSSRGQWNFSSIGSQAGNGAADVASNSESEEMSGKDIAIKKLRISEGSITIDQGGKDGKPSTYSDVDISASDLSFTSSFPFKLSASLSGGGSFSLEGQAGPIGKKDLMTTPLSADLSVKKLNLIESGFVSPDTGLAGIFDFEGALTSDGLKVESKGTAKANSLQVVKGGAPAGNEVSLDYEMDYDLKQQSGVLDSARLMYGNAVANLTGNYRRQQSGLAMNLKLRGIDMPVDDVKSLLPAFGVVLPKGASLNGGVINADVTAEGPLDKLGINGTADVTNTMLTGFDLAGKMAVVAKLAGIKSNPETVIETFASKVRVTPAGIRVNDLNLVVPALGELTGSGVINPDQSMDFKMKAQVITSGGVGGALTQLMNRGGGSGKISIPFFVRGTTSEPKFVPDVKGTAGGILESQFSGQSGEEGEASGTEKAIGDALKSLFGN